MRRLSLLFVVFALGGACSDDEPPAEVPASSQVVTEAGGTLSIDGCRLDIPPGALKSAQTISIVRTNDKAPAGYVTYSPIFEFKPAGLTFEKAVTVSMRFAGDPQRATLFWTDSTGGYQPVAGNPGAEWMRADVEHFSSGYVGSEVDDGGGVSDSGASGAAGIDGQATGGAAGDAGVDAPVSDGSIDVAACSKALYLGDLAGEPADHTHEPPVLDGKRWYKGKVRYATGYKLLLKASSYLEDLTALDVKIWSTDIDAYTLSKSDAGVGDAGIVNIYGKEPSCLDGYCGTTTQLVWAGSGTYGGPDFSCTCNAGDFSYPGGPVGKQTCNDYFFCFVEAPCESSTSLVHHVPPGKEYHTYPPDEFEIWAFPALIGTYYIEISNIPVGYSWDIYWGPG